MNIFGHELPINIATLGNIGDFLSGIFAISAFIITYRVYCVQKNEGIELKFQDFFNTILLPKLKTDVSEFRFVRNIDEFISFKYQGGSAIIPIVDGLLWSYREGCLEIDDLQIEGNIHSLIEFLSLIGKMINLNVLTENNRKNYYVLLSLFIDGESTVNKLIEFIEVQNIREQWGQEIPNLDYLLNT